MAFVDYELDDDSFVNVTHRVGRTGDWDDLLVVQLMLEFLYSQVPILKKTKPTKGPVTVTGKPAADTPILIAHYQKTIMKRPKPQGYINRAVGTGKQKESYTILKLNRHMEMVLVVIDSSDSVISYLKKKAPLLASALKTGVEKYQENFPQPIIHPPIYQ
jgi:hypothetical protein